MTARWWRVGLAQLDWANPACGYDFPTETAAARFAAAHRTPSRNVVVFSPAELAIPEDMTPLPRRVSRRRGHRLPVISDEMLALFEEVTS